MSHIRTLLAALGCAAAMLAHAEPIRFDAATNLLTIPAVRAGNAYFGNVTLRHRGNYVFEVQGGTPLPFGAEARATFDTSTGVLTLPAVQVGTTTYLDVTLRDTGGLVFALQGGTEMASALAADIAALMRANEQLYATAVPPNGAARLALSDPCYLHNGRTAAYDVAAIDGDLSSYLAGEAYQIGRSIQNVHVLALRNLANADGSTRREIEVEYDIVFRDGTASRGVRGTLISGSSHGSCATPLSSPNLRFFGNRRVLAAGVQARHTRDERYSRTTGAALSPAVNYRRAVRFDIVDPMGNADYVVVTGPGPSGLVGGVATQFSLKFLSTRLLRSAPELQGKNGNFLNWREEDGFRFCRITGSNVPVAAIADCVGQGATGFDWGWTTGTPNAAADQGFADQGWVAGGIYRFDVYKDDGWKTVNGHAGRTPIATYWDTLHKLPYTFVQMVSGGPGGTELFPRLNFGAMSTAQVASNATSASPIPMSVTWAPLPPMPDGVRFAIGSAWEFNQGAKVGNANGAFNPAYRNIHFNYPGSTATAQPAWPVTAKPADQSAKSYFEFTLLYTDRMSSQFFDTVSFQ